MDTTRISPRSILIAAVAVGVIAVLVSAGLTLFLSRSPVTRASFYEDGAYQTYEIAGGTAALVAPLPSATPGKGVYPNGDRITMTSAGLEWRTATGTTKFLLIDRAGRSPETSFVSEDGTLAVVYNDVTNELDVFSVGYQGASVSYLASIPSPAVPGYLIAGAAAGPATVVLHAGNPETFLVYRVEAGKATLTGTATRSDTK